MKIWTNISYIGIDKDTPEDKIQKIIISNQFAFSLVWTTLLYVLILLINNSYLPALLVGLISIVNYGVIVLNKFKKYDSARLVGTVFPQLLLLILGLMCPINIIRNSCLFLPCLILLFSYYLLLFLVCAKNFTS